MVSCHKIKICVSGVGRAVQELEQGHKLIVAAVKLHVDSEQLHKVRLRAAAAARQAFVRQWGEVDPAGTKDLR